MLYFTYGSFMDIENLKKHCPSAEFVCRGMIPNWEVQFNYYSTNYNGGVTGIEPAINGIVRGAVYEIPPMEMEHLDTIEGIPNGKYYRHPIMVVSEAGEPMLAHVYRTQNPRGPFNPTKLYLKYMIEGAKALGLSDEYITTLQRETVD
jgi:gamma-glutamylcyclotransferase